MHVCGIKKNGIDEHIHKAEIQTQTYRTNIWTPRGDGSNGRNWEIGIDIYICVYIYIYIYIYIYTHTHTHTHY